VQVARADALQPGDLGWLLPVIGPHQMATKRPGSAQYALELQTCDDVREARIVIGVKYRRVEHLIARSQDHRSHLELGTAGSVVIADGFSKTDLFAQSAAEARIPVNGKYPGHGLGVTDIGSRTAVETTVVLADRGHRAYAGALAAARAASEIDIARLIDELCYKTSRLAIKGFDFGIGNDVDIVMPADLDQFG